MRRAGRGVNEAEVVGGLTRHIEPTPGILIVLGQLEHALVSRHSQVKQTYAVNISELQRPPQRTQLVECAAKVVLDLGAGTANLSVARERADPLDNGVVAVVHLAIRCPAKAGDAAQETQ